MSILTYLAIHAAIWLNLQGLGRLALRLTKQKAPSLWIPWIGFSLGIGVLECIHLLLPMQSWAAILLALLGIVGWTYDLITGSIFWKNLRMELSILLLCSLIFGWGATMGAVLQYDWGLYYQQAQKWASTCPAVPGLGNLYGRLAFPGPSFLACGLLDSLTGGPWGARLVGGFMASLALATWSWELMTAYQQRNVFNIGFAAAIFASLAAFLDHPDVGVAAPDFLASLLVVAMGWWSLSFLQGDIQARGMILPLATGLVLLKLSNLIFVPLVLFVLLLKGRFTLRRQDLAVCSLPLVGWAIHNWITSGWPLFPFGIAIGSPDWAMSPVRVTQIVEAIRGWARQMGPHYLETLHGHSWVAAWANHRLASPELQTTGIVIGVFGAGRLLGRTSSVRLNTEGIGWILLVCCISLSVWWFSAPDLRFIRGMVWLLAAICSGSLLEHTRFGPVRLAVVLSVILLTSGRPLFEVVTSHPAPLNPRAPIVGIHLPSGLHVWTPLNGDQVWSAPIPATPEITNLYPRGPSLCNGFRDDGSGKAGAKN